jgi:hypothetical protein
MFGKIRGLVLGASEHRKERLLGKGWLDMTGSAHDAVGRRSYPVVLKRLASTDRKNSAAHTLVRKFST